MRWFIYFSIVMLILMAPLRLEAATCGKAGGVTEDFSTADKKNTASTTAVWSDGEVRLPNVGSGYVSASPGFASGLNNYRAVEIGDLDGDNLDDLLLVGDSGLISVHPQQNAFASVPVANGDASGLWDVVIADFNGDMDNDFATIDSDGEVRIWFNQGSLSFSNSGVLFTDSDAAGAGEKSLSYMTPNLYVGLTNKYKGKYYIRVYEVTGNGTSYTYNGLNDVLPGGIPHMVAIGDMDGVNSSDLLVAESGSGEAVKLMVTDISGNFTAGSTVATISDLTDIEIQDLDGDTDKDFVVSVNGNSVAGWYENDGTGNFTFNSFLDTGGNPINLPSSNDIAIGKLNSDDIWDVFYLDSTSGNIRWVVSDSSSGYGTSAVAVSINILDVELPPGDAIEQVDLINATKSDTYSCPGFNPLVSNNSCIRYGVKNIEAGTWEYLEVGDSVNFSDSGNKLYFIVELAGDGTDTPTVSNLGFMYHYSGDRYVYRAESVVDKGPRVLVQGSFKFGAIQQGMIEAYDLNQIPPVRIGLPITGTTPIGGWQVYTSDSLGTLQSFNYSAVGLGLNDIQSLGGIDHSAPAIIRGVVFPQWYYLDPDPDEKDAFDEFYAFNKNRTTYWFIGANDGKMHALDGDHNSATFGHEYWAYLPSAYKADIVNNYNDSDPDNDVKVDVGSTVVDVYDPGSNPPGTEQYRTLLAFPLGKARNEIVCLDVTTPETPEAMWEFPVSDPTVNSMDYGNMRGVVAMGRIQIDGASVPETHFGVFGVSAVPYPGDVHPVSGDPVKGYTVRMFILDALTGEMIRSFPIYYDTDLEGYAPPGPSLADRDRDGYVDVMFFADLNGDLQTVLFADWTDEVINGVTITKLDEETDPALWDQRTFFDAPFDAMAYNRVSVGYGGTGDLIAYYGTAGDVDNRFYAVCVRGNCINSVGEGGAIYTIGDDLNESVYLNDERILSSPVVINRNVFFIGTSNKYIDGGGTEVDYPIDFIIPCGSTFPPSTMYAVRLGSGNGFGVDVDGGAAHVKTQSINDTVATAQAVGESVVGVTQDGQVMFEESPFSEGDEGSGLGDTYVQVLGWIEVQ